MRILSLFSVLGLFLILGQPLPATAQDTAETLEQPATDMPVVKSNNPHIPAMENAAKELAENLNPEDIERFIEVKENFGMIRAVRVAHKDIKNAVKQCGKKNPDMKKDMNEALSSWEETVKPRLDTHEKSIKTAIDDNFPKDYAAKIKTYLGLIDKAATFANGKIEKTPVTSPEACTGLLESMTGSQEKLGGLLDDISWDLDARIAARKQAEAEAITQRQKDAEELNK